MKKNKEDFNIEFPIVRNVQTKLLADNIQGKTSEEVREIMKKMFDEVKKMTGMKIVVKGTRMPTRKLFPDENKEAHPEDN